MLLFFGVLGATAALWWLASKYHCLFTFICNWGGGTFGLADGGYYFAISYWENAGISSSFSTSFGITTERYSPLQGFTFLGFLFNTQSVVPGIREAELIVPVWIPSLLIVVLAYVRSRRNMRRRRANEENGSNSPQL